LGVLQSLYSVSKTASAESIWSPTPARLRSWYPWV